MKLERILTTKLAYLAKSRISKETHYFDGVLRFYPLFMNLTKDILTEEIVISPFYLVTIPEMDLEATLYLETEYIYPN